MQLTKLLQKSVPKQRKSPRMQRPSTYNFMDSLWNERWWTSAYKVNLSVYPHSGTPHVTSIVQQRRQSRRPQYSFL